MYTESHQKWLHKRSHIKLLIKKKNICDCLFEEQNNKSYMTIYKTLRSTLYTEKSEVQLKEEEEL